MSLNFVQGYDCYSSSKIAILKKLFSSTFCVYNNIKQLSTSSDLEIKDMRVNTHSISHEMKSSVINAFSPLRQSWWSYPSL